MSGRLEAKNLYKSEDFRIASLEEKAGESSILEEKCSERHWKNVFCFGKEKKIANIYSSKAPLPAQNGHPKV